MKKILASSVSAVLLLIAPGPLCYRALAGTVSGQGPVNLPNAGSAIHLVPNTAHSIENVDPPPPANTAGGPSPVMLKALQTTAPFGMPSIFVNGVPDAANSKTGVPAPAPQAETAAPLSSVDGGYSAPTQAASQTIGKDLLRAQQRIAAVGAEVAPLLTMKTGPEAGKIFDNARDPNKDFVGINLQDISSGSPYAHINLARAHGMPDKSDLEEGFFDPYYLYATGALLGEPGTSAPLKTLDDSMSPHQSFQAQRSFVALATNLGVFHRKPRVNAQISPNSTEVLLQSLRPLLKPSIYLAGPWGFPDFQHKNPTYGSYVDTVEAWQGMSGVPPAGFDMLRLIALDIEAMGFLPINPWINTFSPQMLSVIFGFGTGLDGKPWAEGSLNEGTISRSSLLHWLEVFSQDHRLDSLRNAHPERYAFSNRTPTRRLEEIFRRLAGDLVYYGNMHHIRTADIVFANLNEYRRDVDAGTLVETVEAIHQGKPVVILVDKDVKATLGEPVFGGKGGNRRERRRLYPSGSRWNMMVNGLIDSHPDQVRIFHHIDDVLEYLKRARNRVLSARDIQMPAKWWKKRLGLKT